MDGNKFLLLTDIVDSTEQNRIHGDAVMGRLWDVHDRAARALIHSWRGREIGRSDGFLALFESAADALGFGLAYHDALRELEPPLRARVGIHAGPVHLRANSPIDREQGATPFEVDGISLPIAARVMSAALGGQTLLTADTVASLGPTTARLTSHGLWRLKGIAEPIELFEAASAGNLCGPPADSSKAYAVTRAGDMWLPRRQIRHTLPAERDPFVGRRDALQAVHDKFDQGARLVTLAGVGGSGKTRLATRYGWSRLGDFPGGVWFCDLSAALGLEEALIALARGLGVPLGASDPGAQVKRAAQSRGCCLIIIDNLERITGPARALLGDWLDQAGEFRLLATSREVLGIAGEAVLDLPSLDDADGASLFEQRAASAVHGFRADEQERATVLELVRQLDGLPLAIELAAARTRIMSPQELLRRMNERLELLGAVGGKRSRQSTLLVTLDESWELLSEAARSTLAQLCVFDGGFTLAACEAVADLSALPQRAWIVDAVQSLVDKSLLRRIGRDRFGLLGIVKDYAQRQIARDGLFPGSGPALHAASRARHWRHFAAVGEGRAQLDGCVELDNLIMACRRATAAGDGSAAVETLMGVWSALQLKGPFRLGLDLAEEARGIGELTSTQQAKLDWIAGAALQSIGRTSDARRCFEAGLVHARAAADEPSEIRVLWAMAEQATSLGQHAEASRCLARATELMANVADRSLVLKVLTATGHLAFDESRFDEAQECFARALALAVELGESRREGGLHGTLGVLHHAIGHLEDALRHYERALALARHIGDKHWEGNTLCNLGLLHLDDGDPALAGQCLDLSLQVAKDIGHPRLECVVLCNLGLARAAVERDGEALSLQKKALALANELSDLRSEGQIRGYMAPLLARHGEHTLAAECAARGAELLAQAGDQMSLGVLVCCAAQAELEAGNADAAAASLARAEAIAVGMQLGPTAELSRGITSLRHLIAAAGPQPQAPVNPG